MKWLLYILMAVAILALAALQVAVLVVPDIPQEVVPFREPGKSPEDLPPADPGDRARICVAWDKPREMTSLELTRDEPGLMSVAREPTGTYTFLVGKGRVSIPLRDVRKIEVEENQVRVTAVDGRAMEGIADERAGYSLSGFLMDAKVDLPLRDVRSVEFLHAPAAEGPCPHCGRIHRNPEWRCCPFDGRRLRMDAARAEGKRE
jgi:hypothetical protein